MTQHLRFAGAARGAVETVEVEITSVVSVGGQPRLVQPILLGAADRLWLTIGASAGDTCSIACEAWRFEEIEPQWDRLILRSSIDDVVCQEALLAELGRPRDLIARWTGSKRLAVGVAFFCGAPPLARPLQPGQAVETVLDDPVLGRQLTHSYRVQSPPLVA